jgi:hypothetical protein
VQRLARLAAILVTDQHAASRETPSMRSYRLMLGTTQDTWRS